MGMTVHAADVSLDQPTGTYGPGDMFSFEIIVDPQTDSVKTVEGTLSLDPAVLEIVQVTKAGSVFDSWALIE